MIVHLNYHSSDSNEDFSDNDSEPSDASSGVEADQAHNTDRHTVTFKVIGCTKETIYQSVLVWARNMIEEHSVVEVKLQREPNNPYDPNAVAFLTLKDGKFLRIGYVVKEISHEVCNVLARGEILSVSFKWIKYITDWSRSGPGFFAGVNVTKKGKWSTAVMRASSTR